MRVVLAADDEYAMPLAVSLRSLVDNCADPASLSVTILTQHISDRAVDRVLRSCEEIDPEVVPVEAAMFAELPVVRHISTATYLRLLIPSLFPEDERVVYVDADTVVLADVSELFETPLDGRPLGAVADPAVPRVDAPGGVRHWRELGLDGRTPYFNAGILLMDTKAWSDLNLADDVLAYVRLHGDGIFLDQEALNAVLRGNWRALHPAWNVYPEFAGAARVARRLGIDPRLPDEHAEALANPKIVHFVGSDKPWLKVAEHGPFGENFYHYLDRTDWSGWRPA